MNVREMIEILEEYAEYDENMEVRLATQPSWPFEWTVAGVTSRSEAQVNEIVKATPGEAEMFGGAWLLLEDGEVTGAFDTEKEARAEVHGGSDPDCVFILEGAQIQYASKNLWSEF